MRTLGTLEPVIYFVNHTDPRRPEGYVVLAPFSSFQTPEGHSREEAHTLAEVDVLQKRLIEQEQRTIESEYFYNEALVATQRQEIRDRLYARMVSSSTSEYEKEFIQLYLQLREDRRAKYRQTFLERTMYLRAREMDTPKDRRADEERVNTDRIG